MSYYEREPRGGAATTHVQVARCAEAVAEAAAWARPGTSLAIAAVPMAVLRVLPFSPPVPGRYLSAWQRAGLAHNAKLHVPLTRPAAASAGQSVPDRFWTWTAADRTGQVQPVLHAFGGTEEGLAALAVSEGPATWMERALRSGARAGDEVLAHARA
jgi:hypothetical protein